MRKLILSLFICSSAFLFSQQTNKQVLVLVDGNIASEALMKSMNSKNIESVNVYKTGAPEYLKNVKFSNFEGVVEVKLKENSFDRIHLANLNEQFKLPKDTPVYFDGMLFKDTSMYIIGEGLAQMEIKTIDGKKSLSISSTKLN